MEQTSTDLARRFDTIRVENLNVRGMTRSARGTIAQPGSNVRQKAGLNRGILAAGWGQLVARSQHKAPGRVEKTNAAYTSQTCAGHHTRGSRFPGGINRLLLTASQEPGTMHYALVTNGSRGVDPGVLEAARAELETWAEQVDQQHPAARSASS